MQVSKGPQDIITDGHVSVVCSVPASLKRCGGQGDVLAGGHIMHNAYVHVHITRVHLLHTGSWCLLLTRYAMVCERF